MIRRLRQFIVWGETEHTLEDVPATVEDATQLALVGNSAKAIDFKLLADDGLPKIQIDRIQIQQVVQNLVRNAVDALENWDGEKQITVRIKRESENEIAILVEDSGPGLASEVRDHLFEPFVTTKKDGMGIGLSVCRNIVEAHGGRISGENCARGAKFQVLLPVERN